AFSSWTIKVGLAVGGGAAGYVLTYTGFDQALGGNQAEHTLTAIRLWFAAIPIFGALVASIILLRYPLTKEVMADIRTQLEARRGKV
ncbi:MAG TPA: MFS transporter, partial [Lacunisphaera sp.]